MDKLGRDLRAFADESDNIDMVINIVIRRDLWNAAGGHQQQLALEPAVNENMMQE
jgi:hypothetical protein